jgi:TIR domain
MSTAIRKRIKIFSCYAPEDRELLKQLNKHLSPLRRMSEISTWSDCDIQAGNDWAQEIQTHLDEANIVLVLVSPDFIASNYCYGRQMQMAFERHNLGKAHIIPIILRPVIWEDTTLGRFQALPTNRTPITSWTNLDEAFWDVARGIRQVVRTFLSTSFEDTNGLLLQHTDEGIATNISLPQASHNMINTKDAIDLFHQLMRPNNQIQVLRLVGAGKMGKSHLLAKIFPILARQKYQARYLLLDLRNPVHTIPDILYAACSQLGSHMCDNYLAAYKTWMSSSISFEKSEDALYKNHYLTSCFVKDLAALDDHSLLLLFDSMSSATRKVQTWLMDVLLVQISSLPHVRVILAGRSLPKAHSNSIVFSHTYHLLPITDEEAYIEYCKNLHMKLGEQSIRDFAYACDYTPGTFADLVLPKFMPQEIADG